MTLKEMRESLQQKKGRKDLLQEQLVSIDKDLSENRLLLENTQKARIVIQAVAKETQQHLEFHISGLVSMALASVFPDPYEFKLRFVEKRNVTEAELLFIKNGNESDDILSTGGGGVADIASFALRVALWSLHKTRPVFLLDEPDKFLHSPVYQEKASLMMKELCKRLGIQIVMVSDQPNVIAAADKIIKIEMEDGVSFVGEKNESL